MNTRKSCGHDLNPPRLLKESASVISEPLAKKISRSISLGHYPSRCKMGQVTPSFKKDDEFCKKNYRPITVLPALNNIFERILAKQLESFYQDVLSGFISAYRPNYSCGTTFFNVHINDLFYHIKQANLNAYADDQQLYSFDKDLETLNTRLEHKLEIADSWNEQN